MNQRRFHVGGWDVVVVSGGRFQTDGGSMFGVVPKSLWSRTIDCDDANQIAQDTNCLLARGHGRVVVVDTGYGDKLHAKQREWMHAEEGAPLLRSLAGEGVQPADVTDVVFSHLHYDHAGGASCDPDLPRPTFPQATHHVQRLEWDVARSTAPELRGAYPAENLVPLADVSWNLIEGVAEVHPGLSVLPTPGHTMGHQAVLFAGEPGTIAYLGDLCPTSRHLPPLWCMAYDVDLLSTRRTKLKVLGRAADEQWVTVFSHDPDQPTGVLRRDDRRGFALAPPP